LASKDQSQPGIFREKGKTLNEREKEKEKIIIKNRNAERKSITTL